jgi:iron complex outermembrane receptor protein
VTPGAYGWNGYNCNSPSRTRRAGFDASFSWIRDKTAEFSVSYGAVRAQFAGGGYQGNDVPLVPNHRIRVEAGVWLWDDFELKGGWRYVGAQRLMGDFGNDHGELGGYCLFDIGFIYEPSWAEGWSLSLVVDNLLDREYCDFAGWSDATGAYYYPARARSFLLTVAYEF